jgi:cystathionine beta-lyase/cystathionine gamma-synthase
MKYAVEMGLGAIIYIQSFTKTASGIQNFLGGGEGYTDSKVIS